jgi:glycosyl-4,4'-diaponeurosporenoate acyltransferase
VIWPLPDGLAVALSSVVWLLTSMAVGRWAVSWSDDRLERIGPLTRIRRWERDGGFWIRHLRVLRWKDRLPEAGAFFGGTAKTSVGSPTTEHLAAFRRETVRAERVHWLIAATGPAHLIWCRPTVGLAMIAFGVAFDAPFIVIQRTNRGRIDRLLRRRA